MELEKQVISLELAKKLKSLNVKQDSLFYWWKPKGLKGNPIICYEQSMEVDMLDDEGYSAFTVAELWEMLPESIRNKKTRNMDVIRACKWNGKYHIEAHTTFEAPLISIEADTEADARALMLIYLIENNLLKLNE